MTDGTETAAGTPGGNKIPLTVPIQAHGEMVSELTISGALTLGDLKGVRIRVGEGGIDFDVGDVPRVIGPLANIPARAAESIDARDLGPLVPVLMDFFGVSRET